MLLMSNSVRNKLSVHFADLYFSLGAFSGHVYASSVPKNISGISVLTSVGKLWENILAISWSLLGHFHGKLMEIIGLKSPGNYSASVRTYNFSILSCERPKPNMSMISGFVDL